MYGHHALENLRKCPLGPREPNAIVHHVEREKATVIIEAHDIPKCNRFVTITIRNTVSTMKLPIGKEQNAHYIGAALMALAP